MRKLVLSLALVASLVAVVVTGASAHGKPPKNDPAGNGGGTTSSPSGGTTSSPSGGVPDIQVFQDAGTTAKSLTVGGASVLPTTRTIPHWFGQTLDPHNGITYGYNMVGANPNTCGTGPACTTHITTDIYPIDVVIDGHTFAGTDVLQPTLSSPQFASNDYTTTPHATVPVPPELLANGTLNPAYDPNGNGFNAGGALSANNVGVQLEDATMRSQLNKFGNYHVILDPVVHDPVTIVVPQHQGVVAASVRGTVHARVDIGWWSSQIQNLLSQADPTHLALYLTDSVVLYLGNDPASCCVIGYHGTKAAGNGGGDNGNNGNAPVQTFAWASYVTPGIFNPQSAWALQDIHALSHEIAEWGDDPFVNNWVEPWLTPTAPQYGCTGILETGDPVVAIGVSVGTNTFRQVGALSWTDAVKVHHTIQTTDGAYHPEDEVFLPWFTRTAPNLISQPTQTPSTNVGRYTLMGDLNPYPGFRQPATGC